MSTHDNTYNGWANYETWNVALYINNDYGLHTMAQGYDEDDAALRDMQRAGGRGNHGQHRLRARPRGSL